MSSNPKYSDSEIERKRLLAIQRRELLTKKVSGGSPQAGQSPQSSNSLQSADTCAGNRFSNGHSSSRNQFVMQSQIKNNRYNPLNTKEPTKFFNKQETATAKCFMKTDNRFAVDLPMFQQQVIEVFKTIPSRSYDVKTRIWDFNIKDYDLLMEKLAPLKSRVVIEGLPSTILRVFKRDNNTNYDSIDLSAIDSKLVESLMPFQREGICYGISKEGRCLIADDMGLGKTIQALGIAHYYMNEWPLLIVTPLSVRYQWSEAIYKFLPSVPIHYIKHFTTGKDFISDAKIVIMSYDILARAIDSVEKNVYGVIIFDECHFLKSSKAARTKAARRIVAQGKRVILLSGTPALSRPLELYSQINLIMPKFLGYVEYGTRYCAGVRGAFGWDFSGSSNMEELQLLLQRCCLIRRLKSEVLQQLPSKIRQVVVLDPTLIKTGTEEVEQISNRLQTMRLKSSEQHALLLQYYSETSKMKLKAIRNYVIDLLESKSKFLIFAHHAVVISEICDTVQSKKIKYIKIDGSTKSDFRKSQCDLFQEQPDYLVAVLSITAANAGITLTAAERVVFAELYWNPGVLCQAEDRAHRIGQKSSVLIQFLVAKNTADDHLWPLMQAKLDVLGKAGLSQNFSVHKTTETRQEVTEQRQTKLDSYVTKSSSQPKPNELSSQDCVALAKAVEFEETNSMEKEKRELHDLLEMDDEDLSTLDLDMVE
ncbi:SWI/SNF-related matrix-associated actin-dependent regulator of chromatin subfamily A-like protein 1 [Athalia rosae]|uniref:SWI/SNF-related matrix-associated actin-dependent regulator of chromatin subfamily A-like protein 1 n=1 Tax=Athalia rosae TaxID=37344 RepID=UPI002033ACE3|nr:SWI/SNF-related matrix-associated actin-dependent regulator of chromatin subfamily A-like protein 1 [Athalia rosae]